jgi:hypothetical protein
MKRIGLFAVMLCLAAGSLQAQISGVTAELKLDEDQYLPDEDLQLKVRISNRSGQEITLGTDNYWISLSIASDNNRTCPQLGEMPVQGAFSLQSGEVGIRALNPTPYYEFRRLGRYRVTATIRIPQWHQEITTKAVYFNVGNGVTLPNLANIQFGMPVTGNATNTPPEVRRYSLLKVTSLKAPRLYFRLTDNNDRVLRIFPILPMTSFSDPEAQLDKYNNLHVLSQIGGHSFGYAVLSPNGKWLLRQTYVYTDTRPMLRVDTDGQILVAGGGRIPSEDDFPPRVPESARTQ